VAYVLRPDDPFLLTVSAGIGQNIGPPGGFGAFWRVGGALQASPTAAMNKLGGTVEVSVGANF
jgi:hypothetical protein